MTGPETFSLYWVKHPSAPKGSANTVPFTRQGDGSWHMPYGSKVTLRNREALPQDTRGRGFHPFLHGTFYNAKCKYESLVASGMCVTLNPREWHGSASIARTSAMPNQGQPDGHGHGDSNWLDQPMRKGGAHEGIVLAIDGDPASCVLFVVNHENLLYLHCHGNKSGQVMLHNWIAKSSGAGVDWFPDCSKWRIRSDGKLQALTHAPPGPHVVGWKSQKAWLVHERDSKALTFDGGALGGEVGWGVRVESASTCVVPGWCGHGSTFNYSAETDAWLETDHSKGRVTGTWTRVAPAAATAAEARAAAEAAEAEAGPSSEPHS